ncbi:hypothetical protein SUREIYA_00750 [Serratia phage vB_SmaM-Sureiya]|nr:hypothetical protein SUREIYA_00750 [Serratia phage vB_SmaM-Sureiya]
MKNVFKTVAVMFLAFGLMACDSKDGFDQDLSKNEAVAAEMRGEVLHRVDYAQKLMVKSVKVMDGVYTFGISIKSPTRQPQVIAFTCAPEANAAGIAHTILDEDNQPIRDVSTLSIMKYRKNIKQVTEFDENNTPLFSTANGDSDFISAMNKLKILDKDTPIAFTIETPDGEGMADTKGWSIMMKAGDLYDAWKDAPTASCKGTHLTIEREDVIVGMTNRQMMGK